MPYEWDIEPREAPVNAGAFAFADGKPFARLHLWPYRSLPKRGFVWVLGGTFAAFLIPLLAFIGSAVLWGLLPFAMGALALLWFFIDKSYRDGEILEELTIWSDHIRLTRSGPHGAHHDWQANPYWVTLHLHKSAGPVVDYLTLKGGHDTNGREVELGAFLDEKERPALYRELIPVLALSKSSGG